VSEADLQKEKKRNPLVLGGKGFRDKWWAENKRQISILLGCPIPRRVTEGWIR